MPGLSGLSNQSCARSVRPLGASGLAPLLDFLGIPFLQLILGGAKCVSKNEVDGERPQARRSDFAGRIRPTFMSPAESQPVDGPRGDGANTRLNRRTAPDMFQSA